MISFISKKALTKPEENKRYNAPHLCTIHDWRGYTNGIYTRNECHSLVLSSLKTVRFSLKDKSENTFKYVHPTNKALDITNIEKFSQNEQHSQKRGIVGVDTVLRRVKQKARAWRFCQARKFVGGLHTPPSLRDTPSNLEGEY